MQAREAAPARDRGSEAVPVVDRGILTEIVTATRSLTGHQLPTGRDVDGWSDAVQHLARGSGATTLVEWQAAVVLPVGEQLAACARGVLGVPRPCETVQLELRIDVRGGSIPG
jgi:hypothetical protein